MKSLVSVTMILLSAADTSHATPREHAKCPITKKITDPEGSSGYYMSEDCSTAYVLPPSLGQIQVAPLVTPDSASTCSGILASVNALSTTNNTLLDSQKEKAALEKKISTDRQACSQVHGLQTTVQSKQEKIETDLSNERIKLDIATKTQTACLEDSEPRECDQIEDQIADTEDRILTLEEQLEDVSLRLGDVNERASNCEMNHPYSQVDNTDGIREMEMLNTKIDELSTKITNERKRLSALPGGEAGIVFRSGHRELVNAYSEENKSLGISFVQMPIKKSKIHFELVRNGRDVGLASVARFNIFGATSENGVTFDGSEIPAQEAERLFGGSAGAQISLNLYAACNLRQKYSDLSSLAARQEIANLIRPTVSYEYELQATKDIQINYNESYLYQLIKERSSHGGLFWSSSSESITENTVASKWLTIVASSEDSDLEWQDQEKVLFDLRREVLDAALGRVAEKTYATAAEAIADGGTPPPNGSQVASKELRKFPNMYCQVAAIALDIGNALFGGSSSTGTTTKTVKKSEVQNLVINGMVKFAGSQSFEPAGE